MDNREIKRAWERFMQNGTASNAVRGVVAASWERSQGYRIPFERSEAPLAPEAEMVQRRAEHAPLVVAARPALQQARLLLAEASSMIILTDPLCRIQRAVELANLGLAEARRFVHNLRLRIVDESGLAAALQGLVERTSL